MDSTLTELVNIVDDAETMRGKEEMWVRTLSMAAILARAKRAGILK